MLNASLTAVDLIELGQASIILEHATAWNHRDYIATRDIYAEKLKKVGFHNAVAASNKLLAAAVGCSIQGRILSSDSPTLENFAKAANDVVVHEASKITLIATDHVPPDALTNFEAV